MFNKILRQTWNTNSFTDGTDETGSMKEDINDIQKQALSMSKTYLKKAWITIVWWTVAWQKAYNVPDTVDKITNVQVTVDSREYYPTEISFLQMQTLANTEQTSDIPVYFAIDKTQLVLYPTPESNSLPIEINANQLATDLEIDPSSSTDQNTALEIKEWYENVIYYYCLVEAFTRLEDFASADRYERKYNTMWKDYKNEVRKSTNNIVVKKWISDTINPNYYSVLTN